MTTTAAQTLTIAGHDWNVTRSGAQSVVFTCACGCGQARIAYRALGTVEDADRCQPRGRRSVQTFAVELANA